MRRRHSTYGEQFCPRQDCGIPMIDAEAHEAWHECMVIFERIDANREEQ